MVSEVTIPGWAWAAIAFILCSFTGGLGTWVGYTLFDHERRLVQMESTRFTSQDGRVIIGEMKDDLKSDMSALKNDINSLRLDFVQMRRDLDKLPANHNGSNK
jgi:hypothetical protein